MRPLSPCVRKILLSTGKNRSMSHDLCGKWRSMKDDGGAASNQSDLLGGDSGSFGRLETASGPVAVILDREGGSLRFLRRSSPIRKLGRQNSVAGTRRETRLLARYLVI